jgi:hypothetical protein
LGPDHAVRGEVAKPGQRFPGYRMPLLQTPECMEFGFLAVVIRLDHPRRDKHVNQEGDVIGSQIVHTIGDRPRLRSGDLQGWD